MFRTSIFVSLICVVITVGALVTGAGSQPQSKKQCDPAINPNCKTPTPKPPRRSGANRPKPKLIFDREADLATITFDKETDSVIDWKSGTSGATRQPNRQFTVFRQYRIVTSGPEDFTITLRSKVAENWEVQLLSSSNALMRMWVSQRSGPEGSVTTYGGRLADSGTYKIEVRHLNVPEMNVGINVPFSLLVVRVMTDETYLARVNEIKTRYANRKDCKLTQELEALMKQKPDRPEASETLIKIAWDCGMLDRVRPALEQTLRSGGKVEFPILQAHECGKKPNVDEINFNNPDRKKFYITSLVIEREKLEVKDCGDLDKEIRDGQKRSRQLQAQRLPLNSMIEIGMTGASKRFYFIPYAINHDDAQRIKDAQLIIDLINAFPGQTSESRAK